MEQPPLLDAEVQRGREEKNGVRRGSFSLGLKNLFGGKLKSKDSARTSNSESASPDSSTPPPSVSPKTSPRKRKSVSRASRIESANTGKPWRPHSLDDILDDQLLLTIFWDHLIASHCDEHLSALLLIRDFKNINSRHHEAACALAAFVLDKHFKDSAEQPVNMDAPTRLMLCESFQKFLDDGVPVPRTLFSDVEAEIVKLITQDCFGRFVLSPDADRYLGLLDFLSKAFPKRPPNEDFWYKKLVGSKSWQKSKALMEDIDLAEKKATWGRGTIIIRNCTVTRVLKMITASTCYPDWVPDLDKVHGDTSFDYGSALSVVDLETANMGRFHLAVLRLSSNYFGCAVAWQTCLSGDVDVAGCFFVDFDPQHLACKVSLILTVGRTKVKAAEFVQSVLLGMLLAIGGQCEGRDAAETWLDSDFKFLRKI